MTEETKKKLIKRVAQKDIKVYVLKIDGQPVKSYDEDEPDMTSKFNAIKASHAAKAALNGCECDMKIEIRDAIREYEEEVEVEDNEHAVDAVTLPS